MSPTSPSTPRKRPKVDSFATSLSQLVSSLQALSRSLASESSLEATRLLQDLSDLSQKRQALETAATRTSQQSEREQDQPQSWKDELDRLGTELWNRSTVLRGSMSSEGAAGEADEWRKVIAQMRLQAFQIISLGAVEPLADKDHAHLLSLSTKTVTALRIANDGSTADGVLSAGAEHCAAIDLSTSSTSAIIVRTVLAHYTARMNSSVQGGKDGVAEWIKSKIKKDVLPSLNEREIIKLAESSFEAASWLIAHRRLVEGSVDSEESSSAKAIPWLLWSLELLEGMTGEVQRLMQVNVLSTLTQAHLDASPTRSGWQKAEETINQLLLLQPSAEASRRRIKLVVARGGGDGEIIKSFVDAASATPWTEEDGAKLLHEVHKLPASRCSLIAEIVEELATAAIRMSRAVHSESATPVSSARASSPSFLGQVVMLAVLIFKDKRSLCNLFTRVANDAPNFRLDSNSAFLCTTYIWRAADKAHTQGDFDIASRLYLLCTKPMMLAIKSVWAKSFRKAAMCLSELKKFDEADENMRRAIALDDIAKSHFVRFYNFAMNHQVDEASACLSSMVAAKGFSVQLLLWSAKAAQGAALKPLLTKVLDCLLVYCTTHPDEDTSVDLLALLRCLIRLTMERIIAEPENTAELLPILQRHFEICLDVSNSLLDRAELSESLSKNVSWLQKTGYNLCARLGQSDDLDVTSFSRTVVGLMELESKLLSSPDPDTQASLWACQLATLAEEVSSVRDVVAGVEQESARDAVLGRIQKLSKEVEQAKPSKSTKETVQQVMTTVNALEVDVRATAGDWKGAVEVIKRSFNSAGSTEKSMKLLAQRAAEDASCPADTLLEILTLALKGLFSNRALDPLAVASWIRFMVGVLIDNKPAEAFSYLETAATFITDLAHKYPVEEQLWVTVTTWDKGIDHFMSQSPAEGRRWCTLAISIARSAQSRVLPKMQADLDALCKKYGGSENGETESTWVESV